MRGGGAIEGQSEADRQEFAERALRKLYEKGLIFFFRVPAWADIGASADEEDLRLRADEADPMLSNTWWRGRLPADHPNTWWGPNQAGKAAANDPPDQRAR